MNVQIPPELLLLIKMHNMDVRNGLFGDGSHSGLCQHTKVWTSIICLQCTCTWSDHLIPGLIFFLSECVDLPASWSCLLQNSVLVLLCSYSSAPTTDESTSGSQFS